MSYLDGLRGIASLVVAIPYHYVHFAAPYQPGNPPLSAAPGYGLPLLRGLYDQGSLAVDLFFLLSGYIFAHVYVDTIRARQVRAADFLVRRIARLYPLHLATLVATAILVYVFQSMAGRFPVYPFNDAYHFALNALFLQYGAFEQGYSFNAPSWSLSVEAITYLLFFLVAAGGMRLGWAFAIMGLGAAIFLTAPIGHPMPLLWSPEVGRGIIGFFAGVLIQRLGRRTPLLVATALSVAFLIGYFTPGPFWRIKWASDLIVALSLFGLLTLALQSWPALRAPLETRLFQTLGDLSLAIYLLHFPVQVVILIVFMALGQPIPLASSTFLFGYIAIVLTVSWLVHYRFERPAQNWVRQHFGRKRVATAPG